MKEEINLKLYNQAYEHLISKMKQDSIGSRIAIVFSGSPLYTGSTGSGESEIRKQESEHRVDE